MSGSAQTQTTLVQALARALAPHANQSFALMGNGNAHFIDALLECNIKVTPVRHEAATVASADAYSRVNGGLAIATTTYGAGFTNAVTALTEAQQARTPLILVAGDQPEAGPRPWDIDQELMCASIKLKNWRVTPANVWQTVERAVRRALKKRCPIALFIPYDMALSPAPEQNPDAASQAAGGTHSENSANQVGVDPAAEFNPNAPIPFISAWGETHKENEETTAPPTSADATTGATAAEEAAATLLAAQLEEATAALRAAERPLILAGHGAHLADSGKTLTAIADAVGALTATTMLARGIFQKKRYDLGITGGLGQAHAMTCLAQADVVLVAGASLNQFQMSFGTLFGEGAKVFRIDCDDVPEPVTIHPIRYRSLRGDAHTLSARLLEMLHARAGTPSGWRERTVKHEPADCFTRRVDGFADHPDGLCEDGLLDPRCLASRLNELLPQDRHITSDGGHFIGWGNMFWDVAEPGRLISVGTAYQTIGLGLATVAGVAMAAPGSTVVLSTGDGGTLMSLADMETAIRVADSLVVVVWNDGCYGAEVHLYGEMGVNVDPMLIPAVDFASAAQALGGVGVRVNTLQDLAALTEWRDAGAKGAIVLDCRVSRSVVAPYQREIQRVNGLDV